MNVFETIYATNGWNGTDSLSGPGSSRITTRRLLGPLELIERAIEPNSVLHAGCGDDLWTPEWPGYLGIDIVPLAIDRARAFHPERSYEVRDIRQLDGLPVFDLALCRDSIQHVSLADGLAILRQLRAHARWLLVSTYIGTRNIDVATGGFYCPDLTAPPFNMRPPHLLVFDGWDYEAGTRARDPRKYLGLWHVDNPADGEVASS